MHISIPVEHSCEFINVVPVNPLISKCQIKVCWVGQTPNRNRSVITKDVARQMANSLPGSPIVGYYNEHTGDFEEHNRTMEISNGKLIIKDTTVPYGFVDLNAKVWFQKFIDDGLVEREYLVTEGYIWTGQFPEAQRILECGNNQSMELDEKNLEGRWTKDSNGEPQFFIINEAIISKLCILGEDVEPCFEGSQIKAEFALDEGFVAKFSLMAEQLKEILDKGGKREMQTYAVKIGDAIWNALYSLMAERYPAEVGTTYAIKGFYEEEGQKFALLCHREDNNLIRLDFSVDEADNVVFAEEVTEYAAEDVEAQFDAEAVSEFESTYFKKKEEDEEEPKKDDETDPEEEKEDDSEPEKEEDKTDDDDEDKKKKKYALEEIPEYVELSNQFAELAAKYAALEAEKLALDSQMAELVEFKNASDRKAKEDMIASFYMLSDEDKAEYVNNIDKYSVDEIEAQLSILCVRNKVSFALDDETEKAPSMTYGLTDSDKEPTVEVPAWIKAVKEVEKSL